MKTILCFLFFWWESSFAIEMNWQSDFFFGSWLYRIKPSVTHEPFKPRVPGNEKLIADFNQSNSSANPTQLRWKPVDIPEDPTDFIDGLQTICGAGSSYLRHGYAVHM